MTLIRHYKPSTRLDYYELDGLLTRLDREIAERGKSGERSADYYIGAYFAFLILRNNEYVETQDDFMRIFNRYLEDFESSTDEERS